MHLPNPDLMRAMERLPARGSGAEQALQHARAVRPDAPPPRNLLAVLLRVLAPPAPPVGCPDPR